MSRYQTALDATRGSLPEIRPGIHGLTFTMHPPGIPNGQQLVLRCDDEGEVWASILSDPKQTD